MSNDSYEIAAEALSLAEARRGSLRGILFSLKGKSGRNWKSVYALAHETQRFHEVLQAAIEECSPVEELCEGLRDRKLWWLVRVLCYDATIGSGRKKVRSRKGSIARIVSKNANVLVDAIEAQHGGQWHNRNDLLGNGDDAKGLPRYARINLIKGTRERALSIYREEGYEVAVDEHIPNLLVFPSGTDLHSHETVGRGEVILQDKSSCMAAEAISPQRNWLVLDACAAPGNKTTHLASILSSMGSTIRPCVLALDRDEKRFQILKDRVKNAGAEDLVQCTRTDFLSIDPASKPFCDVKAIVLDPSCSGSGLVNRVSVSKSSDEEHVKRLDKLAHVQKLLLKHALSFPNVVIVSYSTCSIYREENEMVVASVLGDDVFVSGAWGLSRALPQWKNRGLENTFDESQMCIRTDPGRWLGPR
uniref:SAM-dependent MTase RsmB/NOP-type domain-containing protein n=2 Tax=Rhodosorus marinus TaxID=101924 RepID=A0A7S2ZXJ6_9RHOD|mmetsp:Transcript_36620/g.146374  ORF Transcript_36620/g.146374 Transcript_36620/m.146374 type:complete len:418 (+) Transcript_36620:282-1535(+)